MFVRIGTITDPEQGGRIARGQVPGADGGLNVGLGLAGLWDARMRGYREGRFRDDVYWTLQAEYRWPLFWRLKGTAFASVGEVGPHIGPALFDEIETAVGVGGRLRLTNGGVHGRLDVAYSRMGIELYISLGEAF